MPVCHKATEEMDILAFERALNWRSAPRLPWSSLAGSLIVHMVAVAFFCMAALSGPPNEARRPETKGVPPFVPLTCPPRARHQVTLGAAGRLDPPTVEMPDITESIATVNLNSIKLSFALDLTNQLPSVVGAQHGMLALVDKEDLGIARYLMQPPDWQPRPVTIDISRRLRFRMDPPGKWTVFRDLARRYGIDLDQYIGCAVFNAAFGRCLKTAIQGYPGAAGSVSSASLAFAANQACGVEVLGVVLAPKHAPEP
jgi:hypothetical protein